MRERMSRRRKGGERKGDWRNVRRVAGEEEKKERKKKRDWTVPLRSKREEEVVGEKE